MLGHLLPNESEMEAIHQIVSIISQNSHLKNVLKLELSAKNANTPSILFVKLI